MGESDDVAVGFDGDGHAVGWESEADVFVACFVEDFRYLFEYCYVIVVVESGVSFSALTVFSVVAAYCEDLNFFACFCDGFDEFGECSSDDTGLVSSVENAVVAQTAQRVGVVAQSMETSIASSAQATERAVAGFGQYIGGLQAATQQYQQSLQGAQQQALAQFSDQVGAVASNVQGSLMAVVQATQQSISGLDAGIRSLNAVLAQLGQQQVVIQQIAPQVSTEDAKKKGWFGR